MNKECYLCKSKEKEEVKFGEFMRRGKISVHYFCLLLSSNLMQNGRDNEGFLGFLPKDIQEEELRVRSLVCCYCKKPSANISCCAPKCHKSFHLTCGDKHSTEHNFVGTFKSFCHRHVKGKKVTPPLSEDKCCICYDSMIDSGKRFDTVNMIRAPCCKNGWFHKYCLASFAKTAGYFFKCPLCNDSKVFRQRLAYKSIFIPDRDAAWELEPNAFAELLERPNSCAAKICSAEGGRESETNRNEFLFCATCGSVAIHRRCLTVLVESFYCDECASITAVIESTSVVNITPSKITNHGCGEEEDDEIDVGDEFDVNSLSNSSNHRNSEQELWHRSSNTEGKLKFKYASSDSTSDSDTESNDNIKPLGLIKSYRNRIIDELNESDNDINSSGKCENEFSDKQYSSKSFSRQKQLASNEKQNSFGNRKKSDNLNKISYISNELIETSPNDFFFEKEITHRVSLTDSNYVKNDRSDEASIKLFGKACVSEISLKKKLLNSENQSSSPILSVNNCSINETKKTPNKPLNKIKNVFNFVGTVLKTSPMRLRSRSEDISIRPSWVERSNRRSFIQDSIQTTDTYKPIRTSELLESTSIKRCRLDSSVEVKSEEILARIDEDENIYSDSQSKGNKNRTSRELSPLGVNLCEMFAYTSLPYLKKKSQNDGRMCTTGNLNDIGKFFSKSKLVR